MKFYAMDTFLPGDEVRCNFFNKERIFDESVFCMRHPILGFNGLRPTDQHRISTLQRLRPPHEPASYSFD